VRNVSAVHALIGRCVADCDGDHEVARPAVAEAPVSADSAHAVIPQRTRNDHNRPAQAAHPSIASTSICRTRLGSR
jgi:hypothetical protein